MPGRKRSEKKPKQTTTRRVGEKTGLSPTAGPALLVVIHPPGTHLGQRFELKGVVRIVGRTADADVMLLVDGVSRKHARLLRSSQGWQIEDLRSTNGTYVNDQPVVKRHLLRDGDLVKMGKVIAKFLTGATAEAAYHEQIFKLAASDALTGAHNKRYFDDFLTREIAAARRHGTPLALVVFDVDHFKKVNDGHGHVAGDTVLGEIGRRVASRVRREDLFARCGGEEFACVLTRTARQGALTFAQSLRELISATPVPYEDRAIAITMSFGVVELAAGDEDANALLKRADACLYAAKRTGRNRVVAG